MRYDMYRERLEAGVLGTLGDSPAAVRRAVLDRAKGQRVELPRELAEYVDTVARHAYKVTDTHIDALRTRHSDDALFEITVAAAVGAALHRLDRGLAALRGEEPD
jgi:hypothetical protein